MASAHNAGGMVGAAVSGLLLLLAKKIGRSYSKSSQLNLPLTSSPLAKVIVIVIVIVKSPLSVPLLAIPSILREALPTQNR